MANVLNTDKKIAIIAALAEGSSIRSIERMTGVHRDTIMRLGVRIGQGCKALMDFTHYGCQSSYRARVEGAKSQCPSRIHRRSLADGEGHHYPRGMRGPSCCAFGSRRMN